MTFLSNSTRLLTYLSCFWFLAVPMVACQESFSPDDPRAVYQTFRDGLLTGDTAVVWSLLTPTAQQVYENAYGDLLVMEEAITLLSEDDQRIVRERTGVGLLQAAASGEALFGVLTHLQYLINDDTYRQGSEIENHTLEPNGSLAEIITRSGQTIFLTADTETDWRIQAVSVPDNELGWRNIALEALALDRLSPIAHNVMAVELMASEAAASRRSPAEIERILSGQR